MTFVKVIWILFTFSIASVQTEDSSTEDVGCEAPWIQIHRSCMLFNYTQLSWEDARYECTQKQGDLVVLSDKNELNAFTPELKKRINSTLVLDWWIGLNYSGEPEDVWKWVDGSIHVSRFIGWAPGEPDNGRNRNQEPEDCVVFNYQKRLKDLPCSTQKAFVCEETKLTTTVSTTTYTTTTTAANTTTTTTIGVSSSTEPPTTTTTMKSTTTTTKPSSSSIKSPTPPTDSTSKPITSPVTVQSTSPVTVQSTSQVTDLSTFPMTNYSTVSAITSTTSTSTIATTSVVTVGSTSSRTSSSEPTVSTIAPTQSTISTSAPITTTQMSEEQLWEKYQGCYAINLESTCPPTEALGIFWPETNPGEIRIVDCDKGKATWLCDPYVTCWRGQPDVRNCTSEEIKNLSDQLDEVLTDEDNTDAVIEFTEDLITVIESDSVQSEQDIFQSTKLLDDVAKATPKNSSSARSIIKNVVKCGDSLIAKDKASTWKQMKTENKKMIASSLLNSMETVTMKMMKSVDEPFMERIVQETMEVELTVLDVNTIPDVGRIAIYKGQKNEFFMSPSTLRTHSLDGLSRVVIINYNNMEQLLPPEDFRQNDGVRQEIISQVMSASIGDQKKVVLNDPVTFTFNTADRVKNRDWQQMCSFWNFSRGYTGAWSQRGCSLKTYNDTHTTCTCNHLTNFAILMDVHDTKITPVHSTTLSYITYVGIIISIVCLFLSWITFVCLGLKCMRRSRHSHACPNNQCLEIYGSSGNYSDSTTNHLRSVQGERNSIHKHLVFCLFVAEVLFLAGVERTEHKLACSLIAGFLHYFFLASFTWMFIEGIHILFMLVQVFDAAKSRMKYYYILGYGAPLIIVGVSAGIFHEGYGTDQYCWLTAERFLIWSFAGPIAFILLVNLMILVYAMAAVCKHADYVFSKEKSSSNFKGWIQGALALEVLLGLTWVFGYFYINDQLVVMAYLFTIFNSLQGLFIFVFHCLLNKKVRKEYEKFIEYRPTSTSTTNTTSKSANGSTGHTGTYALANSRKQSTGFSEIERKNSSSTA